MLQPNSRVVGARPPSWRWPLPPSRPPSPRPVRAAADPSVRAARALHGALGHADGAGRRLDHAAVAGPRASPGMSNPGMQAPAQGRRFGGGFFAGLLGRGPARGPARRRLLRRPRRPRLDDRPAVQVGPGRAGGDAGGAVLPSPQRAGRRRRALRPLDAGRRPRTRVARWAARPRRPAARSAAHARCRPARSRSARPITRRSSACSATSRTPIPARTA